jgi:hypothetical protein
VNRLEVTGLSVPAVEVVSAQINSGAAQFAVSQTGAFAYLPRQGVRNDSPVVWMTHDGQTAPLRAMPAEWSNPHFSPDSQRLAMDILSGNTDVWIYERARDTLTRLTFDPAEDRNPVWTPMASATLLRRHVPRDLTSIGMVQMERARVVSIGCVRRRHSSHRCRSRASP